MTSRLERITQQRLNKLAHIRERGIDPYPPRYPRSHTTAQAVELLERCETISNSNYANNRHSYKGSKAITVAGRIMAMRKMGKSTFADIRDATGKIQLLFHNLNQIKTGAAELFKDLDIGDIIGIKGSLTRSKTGEPTILVSEFKLLAKSLQPLPEKWHGLSDIEKRYRQRYLDIIINREVDSIFRMRSRIIAIVRNFLNERGFLEVETPVLQPSAGGALAQPFITHHHALDRDLYLRIAPELHLKRLIIGGMDKVYELGRIFRNEGISTKHNPEFTMLESYEAFADYNDVMKMVEDLISEVCQQVLGTEKVKYNNNIIDFKPPWQRLELRDAIRKYSGIDFIQYSNVDLLGTEMKKRGIEIDSDKNWVKLIDELLTTFVEPNLIQPTFLLDYPASMSPLAKAKPDQKRIVERFEGFIGCMEIANAFTELNDPLEQRKRFEEQQREQVIDGEVRETIDEDFLLALEYGMPPTGGLGIGIDRLVMLLTDQQSIRDVILFPQLKEKAKGKRQDKQFQ